MQLHPEGGWFKEIYRSDEIILKEHLPNRFSDGRSFCTGIYFLLEANSSPAFTALRAMRCGIFMQVAPCMCM